MCGVRGKIFHELEVVFNDLVLCLRGTDTLMYSLYIPVESRARSIAFPPETAKNLMHVVRNACVYNICIR